MPRICFALNEIAPLTPGGAGMLISRLTWELLHKQIEVILLLDVDKRIYSDFEANEHSVYPNNHLLKTYHLDSLCKTIPYRRSDFISRYLWESYRYHWGLRQIEKADHPDVVEFVDYCGPAYYSLCSKIFGIDHQEPQIAVRIHGPISLIDQHSAGKPLDFDRYSIYALERQSIKLADYILYPSGPIFEKISSDFQPLRGIAYCSPPPAQRSFEIISKNPTANLALFYGRLYREKGAEKFIKAAVKMLETTESTLSFYLVGADSEQPSGTHYSSYGDYLRGLVPDRLSHRFKFTGHLDHQQIKDILPDVKFAAFPSSFETFGYAVQEIYQSGTPIIVSSIPAFQDEFTGFPDVVFFDGSVDDLSAKMVLLDTVAQNPSSGLPGVHREKDDPVSFYRVPQKPRPPQNAVETVSKVLIVILNDKGNPDDLHRTNESLRNLDRDIFSIIHLTRAGQTQGGVKLIPLFGNYYSFDQPQNRTFKSQNVVTFDAMILLQAGDEFKPEFLVRSASTLSNHPELSYINGWKKIKKSTKRWLHTHPLAAMPELIPFESISNHLRVLLRTKANVKLEELFDQESGNLGECDLLWSEYIAGQIGIDVPLVCVNQNFELENNQGSPALSYLIYKYSRTRMASALVFYLSLIANGFPRRQFPLQNYWARKSGLAFGKIKKPNFNLFSDSGLKDEIYWQLASGSVVQRWLLKFLRRAANIFHSSWQKR